MHMCRVSDLDAAAAAAMKRQSTSPHDDRTFETLTVEANNLWPRPATHPPPPPPPAQDRPRLPPVSHAIIHDYYCVHDALYAIFRAPRASNITEHVNIIAKLLEHNYSSADDKSVMCLVPHARSAISQLEGLAAEFSAGRGNDRN